MIETISVGTRIPQEIYPTKVIRGTLGGLYDMIRRFADLRHVWDVVRVLIVPRLVYGTC